MQKKIDILLQKHCGKCQFYSTGRKHSPDVIEKIRKSNMGKIRSEEARRKMSIAKQNMSEETRKKISEAGKGRKSSQKCIELARKRFKGNRFRAKRIIQYGLDGKYIRTWECAMDVEKKIGINHGNIGKCCNNNAKDMREKSRAHILYDDHHFTTFV